MPAFADTLKTEPAAQAADETPVKAAATEEPAGEKPGLENTMVMPKASLEGAIPAAEAAEQLSPKELKKLEKEKAKEAKRLAKEQKREAKEAIVEDTFGEEEYEEEPRKGGAGRMILMIILIILCIIFALELAGIGIKLLAPTSGAAEFIDNILNSLIHTITG